jgi:hypothetical protein
MHRISTRLTRMLAAIVPVAALVALAIGPAAQAAVPKTGTWRGDMVQELPLLGGIDITFKSKLVITEYEGRIATVVGTVRMECPSVVGVQDVRVLKSWRLGRGPRVSPRGTYAFRANGAYFHGVLSRSSAMGGAGATQAEPECRGSGRYNLQRRR